MNEPESADSQDRFRRDRRPDLLVVARGERTIEEHIGSAHDPGTLQALIEIANRKIEKLQGAQLEFDLGVETPRPKQPHVISQRARVLWEVLEGAYERVGLANIGNQAFKQLVLARVVEPVSKTDTIRVLEELEVPQIVSLRTVWRTLASCVKDEWRQSICENFYSYATRHNALRLVLYDVTTLYFEIDEEDDKRKVGMSKERRVDPQIVVGLLTTRDGFPLEIHSFKGNTAETTTLIPVLQSFRKRHNIEDVVVAADAGMLSAANLNALEDAGFSFIVGSRIKKAPYDLAEHFAEHGTTFTDAQTVECSRVMGQKPNGRARRVVYQFSQKRKKRDLFTLEKQIERAQKVVSGQTRGKKERFVKHLGAKMSLDDAGAEQARSLAGLKGYVTNLPQVTVPTSEVVATYHNLFQIERSFRMAKSDLKARPIFHHCEESIDAHLTVVFAALAVARDLQQRTGFSIQKIVRTLKPLRDVTININGELLTAVTPETPDATGILTSTDSNERH